ncbi:Choline/ethanolaminephosphotransferase [Punctularia strigosozonata HHB-11173 SS5]|uniref:Choline/ethanolaminephosphotransferase n=1 Tax=Punctularia strigosozonata (strain HHB-11173) TaxID=741275 RepID=UPI00044162E3|nr:Choline/ethanolaminephosphotransferase [Punctularia strigosozonata HHB-11173 SS5]EIN14321.1 Choline/ethanolaminephosphotransferase [Punctularia strigosozonata HHB-11173 SS5]
MKPKYIPQNALDRLKDYSYKGVDKSLLSRYVLNPFWTWLVTLWPNSVAPNTITLTGLCMVLLNLATLLYYDPTYLTEKEGATGPPKWIYFTWAAGLFIYQSLDAIDGKQARRTGMAGPLGEMFDHGCDAMNTTLEVILCCRALNLGRSWWTVASQIATLANFYLTTWEEYHTGQLYLGVFSGPVEGIIMIVVVYIVTGFFGTEFWDSNVLTVTQLDDIPLVARLIPNIALKEAFMWFGAIGLAFNIITSYSNVYRSGRTSDKGRYQPLLYLLPFPVTALVQLAWLSHPTPAESTILYSPLLLPFLCAWGLQFAHQVGRMILAHVTSQPFPWFDWLWVWSLLGAVDANMEILFGRPPLVQNTFARTALVVWLNLAVSFASYARFCTLVINDITEFLGIACFTVRKKDAHGEWQNAAIVNEKKSS